MPRLLEPTAKSFSKSSKNGKRSSSAIPVSERLVPIGEIVATHGLEGWVKLNPFNPETTALASVSEVLIEREGARSLYQIEANRPHNRQILIKFQGIDSIDAAKLLIGARLNVTEDNLPALEPGQYYHFQAIGLEVLDTQGNRLGTLTATWSAGGRQIYVVTGGTKEYLIPAVKEFIEKIDFDAGQMIINPPEGLLDL
jgi:16S rRNA processing protein RimM